MPVYNSEAYLRQCLDSILAQTMREIEIICVDDGSTDRSPEILREYAAKDARVRVITQENQFAFAARNAGINAAVGKYIHFCDADDYVDKNAYETMYRAAEKFNADIVKGRIRRIDTATNQPFVGDKDYAFPYYPKSSFNRALCFRETPERFQGMSVVVTNGIFKRSFLNDRQIRFKPLCNAEDRSFFREVTLKADRVVLLRDFVYTYRINQATSMVGMSAKYFDCRFKSYRYIEEMCAQISAELRAHVLAGELSDMFLWYKHFQNGEYGAQIERQLRAFLREIDIRPMLKYRKYLPWLPAWICLMENETGNGMAETLALARQKQRTAATPWKRMQRKLLRLRGRCRDFGLKNTLRHYLSSVRNG